MLDDGLYVVTIACNGKSAGFTLSAAKDTEGNATVSGGVFVTTVKPKSPAFHCGALVRLACGSFFHFFPSVFVSFF